MQSYRAWFNFALIESVKKGFWMLAFYLGSLEFYNYQSKLASMIIILIYDRTKTIFIRKRFSSYFGLNLVRIKGLISVLCCISSISSFSLMLKKKKEEGIYGVLTCPIDIFMSCSLSYTKNYKLACLFLLTTSH